MSDTYWATTEGKVNPSGWGQIVALVMKNNCSMTVYGNGGIRITSMERTDNTRSHHLTVDNESNTTIYRVKTYDLYEMETLHYIGTNEAKAQAMFGATMPYWGLK
jgi:hypothetical protein